MSNVKKQLEDAGHIKIYGKNSLTAGEALFTIAAAAVMAYAMFVPGSVLTKKQGFMLGLAILVFGEAVF